MQTNHETDTGIEPKSRSGSGACQMQGADPTLNGASVSAAGLNGTAHSCDACEPCRGLASEHIGERDLAEISETFKQSIDHFNGVFTFREVERIPFGTPPLIESPVLTLLNRREEIIARISFKSMAREQCHELSALLVKIPESKPFTEPSCRDFAVISQGSLADFLTAVRKLGIEAEEGVHFHRGRELNGETLSDLSKESVKSFTERYGQRLRDDRYPKPPIVRVFDVLPVVEEKAESASTDQKDVIETKVNLADATSLEKFAPLSKKDSPKGAFRWIDIEAPDPDIIERLDNVFGFMADCLSDCLAFEQETTVKDCGDHFFIVTHAFSSKEQDPTHPEALEVHAFISDDLLVTVHADPIVAIDKVAKFAHAGHLEPEERTTWDLYSVLSDAFITSNWPVLERIKPLLGKLQVQAQRKGLSNMQLQNELPAITETLVEMDQVFSQQSRVFREIGKLGRKTIPRAAARKFKELGSEAELLDQKITDQQRVIENITSTSELLSQKRNAETNKSLGFLVAASLPYAMFFAAGGMNFKYLPFDSPGALIAGFAAASVLTAGMLWWGLKTKIIKIPGTRSKE